MTISGRPIRLPKTILGDRCILRLDVDAILPDFDPREPVLTPDTVRLLDRLQALAKQGDIAELEKHGTVYIRKSA